MKNIPTCLLLGLLVLSDVAEAGCNVNIPLTRPDSRYEAVASATPAVSGGEVRDTETNLVWQRCVIGMEWNGSTCIGTAKTFTWQAALEEARKVSTALNAAAWRLPSHAELFSLAERACFYPAINASWFPETPSDWMWSSSPSSNLAGSAWLIHFGYGYNGATIQSQMRHVRLVRYAQ